jgi:hypothetical protein
MRVHNPAGPTNPHESIFFVNWFINVPYNFKTDGQARPSADRNICNWVARSVTKEGANRGRKRNCHEVEEETKLNARHLILPLYSN